MGIYLFNKRRLTTNELVSIFAISSMHLLLDDENRLLSNFDESFLKPKQPTRNGILASIGNFLTNSWFTLRFYTLNGIIYARNRWFGIQGFE